MTYNLSASKLNLLQDCPRCFWLSMKKNVKRPSGPMSSIPIKMDSIIKNYFNKYRMINELPPILNGQLKGRLAVNMPRTLQCKVENGIILWGRPDDYLELEDYNIVILDHKTASKAPAVVHSSYQLQMNVYSFMLKEMGFKTTNKAFLVYYHPDDCDLHNGMTIHCAVREVLTDINPVKDLLNYANDILNGPKPDSGIHCEFCKWAQVMIENKVIL